MVCSKRLSYSRPKWATQQVVRSSGLVEDVCKHGVGHPNSDWLRRNVSGADRKHSRESGEGYEDKD